MTAYVKDPQDYIEELVLSIETFYRSVMKELFEPAK